METVLLVCWNAAEAKEHGQRLERAGYRVDHLPVAEGQGAFGAIRRNPPDLFLIDLNRMPSHGRAVATAMRQSKATRHVPIVIAGGEQAKVEGARQELPDAIFASWAKVFDALKKAKRHQPTDPVVPGTMEAYSGTPLPKKLGIRADSTLALIGAPKDFKSTMGKLPDRVTIRTQARGQADVVMLFVRSMADLKTRLAPARRVLAERGSLWIAWPKQTSGVATDVTQTLVRKTGLASGLVDYKIAAIDKTWSGLRFAVRRQRASKKS